LTAERLATLRYRFSGRPPGKSGAHVLAEQLRKDLAEEWRKRGAAALADLSSADLVKYALASLPRGPDRGGLLTP